MEKKNQKGKGGLPLQIAALRRVHEELESGNPLDDKLIDEFMKSGNDTAEAVENGDLEGDITIEEKKDDTALVSSMPDGCLREWLNEISSRPRYGGTRKLVYIHPDIVDVLSLLKKSAKIPINHLIECILTDWVMANNDELKELLYAIRNNELLK
jgi:hypothetical protein